MLYRVTIFVADLYRIKKVRIISKLIRIVLQTPITIKVNFIRLSYKLSWVIVLFVSDQLATHNARMKLISRSDEQYSYQVN